MFRHINIEPEISWPTDPCFFNKIIRKENIQRSIKARFSGKRCDGPTVRVVRMQPSRTQDVLQITQRNRFVFNLRWTRSFNTAATVGKRLCTVRLNITLIFW